MWSARQESLSGGESREKRNKVQKREDVERRVADTSRLVEESSTEKQSESDARDGKIGYK